MATKQVIEIDVTWEGWSKLRLNALITFLSTIDSLEIKRITVREKRK